MGRTVLAENSIREYANSIIEKKRVVVGLVLGQITTQHHCIIHLVKTPLADEGGDKIPTNVKPKVVEDWDPSLVALHAKQVSRMLLGGIEVLGLFVCSPPDTLSTTSLATLKKMLTEIRKTLGKSSYQPTQEENEQLLIHLSCHPNKITCKTIDVTSSLASPKLMDMKFQSAPIKWNMLRCQLAIDLIIPVAKETTNQPFINQLKEGLTPFFQSIRNATPVVNGILKKGEELLDSSESTKGNRGKQTELRLPHPTYKVDMLLEQNCPEESAENEDEIVKRICGANMQLRGAIEARAYIMGNPTVNAAIQCLKQDIIQSLILRCEMHCEDLLVIEEEQQDKVVIHELPCRIFAPLPTLGILLSDYIFPGEKTDDCLCAFQELLDINVDVGDVQSDLECIPESPYFPRLLQDGDENDDDIDAHTVRTSSQQLLTSCNYTVVGISIAIACIAGGTSYFLFLN